MACCDNADRGGTVLLSSPLLREIEVIADDLVVIGNGRIVAQGTKHELLQSAGALVRASERELVAAALTAAGISFSPVGVDGLLAHAEAEPLGKIMLAAGIPLIELRPADSAGLEEMFLELTAETQRETTNHRQPAGAMS